jgi:hypothetical protein
MNFQLARVGRAALLLSLSGLFACSSSAPLFTPDGRSTSQVQCPAAGTWDTCRQNAGGICGGDFDTIRQSIDNDTRTLVFACHARTAQ